jgi:hypothetical protein
LLFNSNCSCLKLEHKGTKSQQCPSECSSFERGTDVVELDTVSVKC